MKPNKSANCRNSFELNCGPLSDTRRSGNVAIGDEVGIEPLHHEVEVVGIGNRGGSSGNGSGIGTSGSWDCGGQLETTVDFHGLTTHRVDQRTNLNSGSLAI